MAGTVQSDNYTNAAGTAAPTFPFGLIAIAPTIQRFTTGSGTYTLPTTNNKTPAYLKVRMIGGGGGGISQANGGGGGGGGYLEFLIISPAATYSYAVGTGGAAGVNGVDTTFGGNTAGKGNTGSATIAGAGGTNTFALGTALVNATGNSGGSGDAISGATGQSAGEGAPGLGGGSGLGGGTSNVGTAGAANTGAGGGSGSTGGAGGSGVIIVEEYYQ